MGRRKSIIDFFGIPLGYSFDKIEVWTIKISPTCFYSIDASSNENQWSTKRRSPVKLRIAVLFTIAVTFVCVCQTEASAVGRRARVSQPTYSAAGPTTILPSSAEVMAIPAPGQGRLVGYVLNVHPGARLGRMVFGR